MKERLALQAESTLVPSLILREGTFILGRSTTCDLVVRHDTVSRRHAEICVARNVISMLDLNSMNGTFVDRDRVRTGAVRVGQLARFGNVAFLLTVVAATREEANSEASTASGAPSSARETAVATLSKAQRRVFVLLLGGLAEKQVAGKLHISQPTVHNHIQAIYRAFDVHSRPELLARTRWLDPNALEAPG